MLSRTIAKQSWCISAIRATRSITAPSHISSRLPPQSLNCIREITPIRSFSNFRILRASTPMAAETDVQAEAFQNSTGITPESLAETLRSSSTLSPSHVDIQDISGGCGASFAALIVSDAFKGKSALQRHRLVNGLLKEEIKSIHAWTPKCLTGDQWEAEKAKTA